MPTTMAIWGRDEQGIWHLLPRLTASNAYCGRYDMRVLEMQVSSKPLNENVVCVECSRNERTRADASIRYAKPSRRCRACRSTDRLWKCRGCGVRCCEHRCRHRNGSSAICFDCKETEHG